MARPRLGESESKRMQMVITEDELRAIDDWRFENRVETRSEAIRRLVQIALSMDELVREMDGTGNRFVEGSAEVFHRLSAGDDKVEVIEEWLDSSFPIMIRMALSFSEMRERLLSFSSAPGVAEAIAVVAEERKLFRQILKDNDLLNPDEENKQ